MMLGLGESRATTGGSMAKPTVLLTAARFGAGYFLDILQSARPGALVLGEPFRGTSAGLAALAEASGRAVPELQKMDAAALWALVVEVAAGQAGPCVVQLYYYHLPMNAPVWAQMAAQGRVVHLVRRNLFEAYLSRELAQQAGLWRRGSGRGKPVIRPVTLDQAGARRHVEARMRDVEWARETFAEADFHEVAFEAISRAPGACAEAIDRVFGSEGQRVPPGLVRPGLPKVKDRSNADLVLNYRDVADLDRRWF